MDEFRCIHGSYIPRDLTKFFPEKESKNVKSFLKLGHLCEQLVKYVEFHIQNDPFDGFGVNGADDREDQTTEFIAKVTGIAAKAVKKAKDSLEASPNLPKKIKDNMSVFDNPFVGHYNMAESEDEMDEDDSDYNSDGEYVDSDTERLRTTSKVVTKIARFESHSEDDLKILRSTYEALAGIYSSLKELSHFTYCYSHYMSHCYTEESEYQTVWDLEDEMGAFEMAEYWQ